jgi:beta-phosphoglucomutase-like phosphatase (HAD superfamily)
MYANPIWPATTSQMIREIHTFHHQLQHQIPLGTVSTTHRPSELKSLGRTFEPKLTLIASLSSFLL